MSLLVTPIPPTTKGDMTKIACPCCGERVRGVALLKGSVVQGLTFTCKRCRSTNSVETK